MSEAALILAVSTFCKFSNMKIDKEVKIACMEEIVNCSVIKDGQIPEKRVKYCKEQWINND